MAIQFGRLTHQIFRSYNGEYNVYRLFCHGGHVTTAVFEGLGAPPALKSVTYELTGRWVTHPRYGRQFQIHTYLRQDQNAEEREQIQLVIEARKHI